MSSDIKKLAGGDRDLLAMFLAGYLMGSGEEIAADDIASLLTERADLHVLIKVAASENIDNPSERVKQFITQWLKLPPAPEDVTVDELIKNILFKDETMKRIAILAQTISMEKKSMEYLTPERLRELRRLIGVYLAD